MENRPEGFVSTPFETYGNKEKQCAERSEANFLKSTEKSNFQLHFLRALMQLNATIQHNLPNLAASHFHLLVGSSSAEPERWSCSGSPQKARVQEPEFG